MDLQLLLDNYLYPGLERAIRIAVLVAGAMILSWVVRKLLRRFHSHMVKVMIGQSTGTALTEVEKRANTVGGVIQRAVNVLLWAIVAVWILAQVGLDIAPVIAGAGVVGLAVGFGAQNLVRDVISGLFILLENQVRVNDVAIINGTGGLVEEINLRTMVLRSAEGAVHVFPNGAITTLTNLTREFAFYVFETGVAYKENTDRVVAALIEVSEELRSEEAFKERLPDPLEVMGVDSFGDSAVVIKSRIKTKPGEQWGIGREMNRRIKLKFDELGIEIPFPQRTLQIGETGQTIKVQITPGDRDEWKSILKEALAESRPQTGTSGA